MSVTHADFTIERHYACRPQQTFSAFSDPELKRQWFANPGNWPDAEWELEFRVGGGEVNSGGSPGGTHHAVGLGALACLVGSMGGSSPNVGPRPEVFYADYGAGTEIDYLTQLLGDLTGAAKLNREGLERRGRAFAFAVRVPILFAVVYGLVSLF